MTSTQQRAALQRQIWAIANDVRGSVDGWDFKQYVLGTLFYRFISENFVDYITGGDDNVDYAAMNDDDELLEDARDDAIKTKGYFIYPSQLFSVVADNANNNESLNTDLAATFTAIESSANGYPSEQDIKGLFADFDTTSNRLGNTVKAKNERLAAVLKGVAGLDFGDAHDGDFESNQIDLFGDAYEFLISNYAANAGKSGGEFFTPQNVSKLIAQLAMHKQTTVNKIYDPACGSGSLLLQAKKHFDAHIIEDGFFGQELNHTTYNLARMNMFLHNVNYDKFDIQLGDTLIEPHFTEIQNGLGFDAIVSNPPYSVKWKGSDDPTLINDDRYAPAGVLAPKSKADFAFVLHALSYLSSKGRAAIVCFPGIFYRGGAEKKIRRYLVDSNYVETVIALAPNLFFGTTIAVNILVLSKSKPDTATQFIDASGADFFNKETNNNVMTDDHIKQIMAVFDQKADIDYVAKSVSLKEVAANDYNLSVSSYIEAEDTREVIDITQLNAELKTTVARIDQLRSEIDTIVAEIEAD
ncbi:MAG: type I restriction-modification system subunit M [Amphritea sp.]|nr:type I restriction-modification system subunit M [Amphritea sp.]